MTGLESRHDGQTGLELRHLIAGAGERGNNFDHSATRCRAAPRQSSSIDLSTAVQLGHGSYIDQRLDIRASIPRTYDLAVMTRHRPYEATTPVVAELLNWSTAYVNKNLETNITCI